MKKLPSENGPESVRLNFTPDEYRSLKVLSAMRGSGGIKPECEEAARFWLFAHTQEDGQLSDKITLKDLTSQPIPKKSKAHVRRQSESQRQGRRPSGQRKSDGTLQQHHGDKE